MTATEAKKFPVYIYGKLEMMEIPCYYQSVNEGKCQEWASKAIQYKGNDRKTYYCAKHAKTA